MESGAWRDHFGSVYGGPVRWQRIDKEATKDDRRTGRQTGGGGETRGDYGAGTSPAGALAHVPCCHTKGDTIRVGLKDGGGRRENFFFPLTCGVACSRSRWPDMGDGEVEKERVERGVMGFQSDGPTWSTWSGRNSASLWDGQRFKTERGGCVLQTALNGRPKAGGNRGDDGVGNSGKGQICTPDGPKWTAQSVGSGGGVIMG